MENIFVHIYTCARFYSTHQQLFLMCFSNTGVFAVLPAAYQLSLIFFIFELTYIGVWCTICICADLFNWHYNAMVRSWRTCLEERLCWKTQLWRGKTSCRCYITDEFWSSISPNIKTPFSIIDDSVLSRVLFAWPRICAFWANLQNI